MLTLLNVSRVVKYELGYTVFIAHSLKSNLNQFCILGRIKQNRIASEIHRVLSQINSSTECRLHTATPYGIDFRQFNICSKPYQVECWMHLSWSSIFNLPLNCAYHKYTAWKIRSSAIMCERTSDRFFYVHWREASMLH